jgi:16S rRNA (uracil1498-N3)-methyltransferase
MSALPIFYQDAIFRPGADLPLDEDTARHIVQVLRMKEDESLELANGKGSSAACIIREAGKKKCTVRIESVQSIPLPQPVLHLGVALTKNASRNEWLLEKATEMGVRKIIPLLTTRTERERFRFDRLNNILISAMMQSQQYWLPELAAPQSLDQVLETGKSAQILIAHCMPEIERSPLHQLLRPGMDTLILIGPEGDFSKEEVTLAMQHGARGITLGTTRLRTETAAMSACAYFHLLNDPVHEVLI